MINLFVIIKLIKDPKMRKKIHVKMLILGVLGALLTFRR